MEFTIALNSLGSGHRRRLRGCWPDQRGNKVIWARRLICKKFFQSCQTMG